VRKVKERELDHELFGFLTCEPNGVVAPIHQKAMPVILRTLVEVEQWLTAPAAEALKLQRPLPDSELVVLNKAD
jgi:putative SOS response-associated peptidase YedK